MPRDELCDSRNASLRDVHRVLENHLRRAEAQIIVASQKLDEIKTISLGGDGITIFQDNRVTSVISPHGIFDGYGKETVRQRDKAQAEKEVMAFYRGILTDEQMAAIGIDLLMDDYNTPEVRDSRIRQANLEKMVKQERREEKEDTHMLCVEADRAMEEDTSFADQVLHELDFGDREPLPFDSGLQVIEDLLSSM